MSVDFKRLLSVPLDSVKRPPAMPEGTYYGTIVSHKYAESRWADKETGEKEPQAEFSVRLTGHGEDVDPADYVESSAQGKIITRAYGLDKDVWKLKTFLESLGIATSGKTLDAAIPETTGMQVMCFITRRADKNDAERIFNDCKSLRALAA